MDIQLWLFAFVLLIGVYQSWLLLTVVVFGLFDVLVDRQNHLLNGHDVFQLIALQVIDLVHAHNHLDQLFIAPIDVHIPKVLLFQPHVKGSFDKLIRNLFGNRSQQFNDFLLNGIRELLEAFFQSLNFLLLNLLWVLVEAFLRYFTSVWIIFNDSNLALKFRVIILIIGKHSMSCEMVVIPIVQRQMVPTVNTRNEYVFDLLFDSLSHVCE